MPLSLSPSTHDPAEQITLDGLALNQAAQVVGLVEPSGQAGDSAVVHRLAELGFLPGEHVSVVRRGPGGREPIAVQIGDTIFALRRLEAACVLVASEA